MVKETQLPKNITDLGSVFVVVVGDDRILIIIVFTCFWQYYEKPLTDGGMIFLNSSLLAGTDLHSTV